MNMTIVVLLTLLLLVIVYADTNVLQPTKDSHESLIEQQSAIINKQNVIINELINEIKAQQLKDRMDIVKNEEEILKLKKENEELKAIIAGRNNDLSLQDGQRESDLGVSAFDTYSTRFQTSKRAFTPAPSPANSPRKAAFSAKLSRLEHPLTHSEIIHFDVVMSNIGGHYSSATGIFTAPVDGAYFFLVTICSCNNKNINTFLNRNGVHLASLHADDDDGYETGSIGIVLELHKGDYVYVIYDRNIGNCIYGDFSMFSGFQI